MKPHLQHSPNLARSRFRRGRRALQTFALGWAVVLLAGARSVAELSAPDYVLYGQIVLGGKAVTAANTEVVVEARRAIDGPALASYRIGTEPRFEGKYSLRIRMEEALPTLAPDASLAGDTLVIVVFDAGGVRYQTNQRIAMPGEVQELNFGNPTPVSDADGNGLPDAWETLYLGDAGQEAGLDPDQDGRWTGEEFTAGTDPGDGGDVFHLNITADQHQSTVSFLARQAAGVGFEGLVRYYTIEWSTDPGAETWNELEGYTEILAEDQNVTYTASETAEPVFYRGRVWLQAR